MGSLLSSFPWPLRLPFPADPPPLWGLVSVRRLYSSTPLRWKAFLSLACPWGSSDCCCQTNTAKIFFPVSSTSLPLFISCYPSFCYRRCFERVVSYCIILLTFSISSFTTLKVFMFLPVWFSCSPFPTCCFLCCLYQPRGRSVSLFRKCKAALLSCVLFYESEAARWRGDDGQRLLMYAAGTEDIWCESEDEGQPPPKPHYTTAHTCTHSPFTGQRWFCPYTLSALAYKARHRALKTLIQHDVFSLSSACSELLFKVLQWHLRGFL